MVTFALPGEHDAATTSQGTPRSRAPLPFAKRAYAASPYGGSSKRLGTPQSSSARKLMMNGDEMPSSNLNNNSIATARNIFRASAISDSPPVTTFSPNIPSSTMKRVFAPGATPEPSRTYRGWTATAQATPRGVAAKAKDKELFMMRIASPPAELTGENLARQVPKDWNPKGSIYADQFLAHLCPPDLDEEQRRQFFCILDLRRLKYAADEIFSKKDWKLNVINFAKEFEKSRSIILLRYGLYEFQNVKPSKDVLKRWQREHGLPEMADEEPEASTPTKGVPAKKRKADDDVVNEAVTSGSRNKRRAADLDEKNVPSAVPAPTSNKRKATVSEGTEEQPSKMHKSSTSSLFEKIANNKPSAVPSAPPSTTAPPLSKSDEDPAPKTSLFGAAKPASSSLARSVFTNVKSGQGQANSSNNPFGYLSDASSAKNSGVEADGESETDSEPDDSQEAGQSDEPSSESANGSTAAAGAFGKAALPGTGTSSLGGTRESTPSRSLFDRVTKGSDGQPVRAEEASGDAVASTPKPALDQTWNPKTTPMKFGPADSSVASGKSLFGGTGSAASSTASKPLFGNSSSAPTSSIFASQSRTPAFSFGTQKQEKPADKSTDDSQDGNKTGGESDKENDSQPAKKAKSAESSAAAPQPESQPSLFQPKLAADEASSSEPPKFGSNLFGAASKPSAPSQTSSTSNIFGSTAKAAEPAPAPTATKVMQSSTLFGAKPSDPEKPAEKPAVSEAPKPTSAFGGGFTPAASKSDTSSMFSEIPATNAGSVFASVKATSPVKEGIFGSSSDSTNKENTAPSTSQQPSKPTFSFGGQTTTGEKPNGVTQATSSLFGAPKSPTSSAPPAGAFAGSPMKQDEPSPAKKSMFGTGSSSTPSFSFGAAPQNPPSTNIFGASSASANANTGSSSFDAGQPSAAAPASSGSGINFGVSSGTSFNNPFASGASGANSGTATPSFQFGAAPTAPSGGSSPFQFGGSSTGSAAPPAFGSNQANGGPKPLFGGSVASSGTPAFNFTAASPQPPQAPQNTGFAFGSNNQNAAPVFNLQPPTGGASTTGTNSPFSLAGGSSLATTPAGGTPEPSAQGEKTKGGEGDEEEGEKHKQISLTEAVDEGEEILHEVRAKVLKFTPASEEPSDSGSEKPKAKSPWTTQGVGSLRLLKHKESNVVRLLLRSEPRGNVAMNRAVLPDITYKADEKYVKMTTSNEKGDGLETWMIQVKTKDLAKGLAEALEKHKTENKKE